MIEQYALILLGVTAIVFGGIIGIKWVNSRNLDPEIVSNKIKLYQDLNEEYLGEIKHWKGKFNQSKQSPTVEGDFDLSETDDVEQLVGLIMPKISNMLPKNMQAIANSPEIVKLALDYYKKDPKKAQKMLMSFVSKARNGKGSIQGQPQVEESGIPNFNPVG